jgi:flagellar FliL protein
LSANTATATDAGAPAKGKKKLIIMAGAGVLVLVLAAAAVMMMTKKPAADEEGDESPAKAAVAKRDPKAVPVFVPLDPFTVNLADRDTERYAQVGITLEVSNLQIGDQMKVYMPVIRNNILMAIADKSAADLQTREGKQQLATKVMRETSRALGYEVEDEEVAEGDDEPPTKGKKKKKKAAPPELPVTAVHFSNFIIQ